VPELTSVSAVQTFLDDTTLTSGQLTPAINAAEDFIARYCNRYDEAGFNHWLTASRVERLDGNLFNHLLLRWTPVTAIASVALTDTASSSTSITLTDLECDGIAIASLSTSPGRTGRLGFRATPKASAAAWFDSGWPQPSGLSWVRSPNFRGTASGVVVTYTGGYASAGVLPRDLTYVATMMAASMYRQQTTDPDVISESLGEWSQTRRNGKEEDTTLGSPFAILERYRRYTA